MQANVLYSAKINKRIWVHSSSGAHRGLSANTTELQNSIEAFRRLLHLCYNCLSSKQSHGLYVTSYRAGAGWNSGRFRGLAGELFQVMHSTLPLKPFRTWQPQSTTFHRVIRLCSHHTAAYTTISTRNKHPFNHDNLCKPVHVKPFWILTMKEVNFTMAVASAGSYANNLHQSRQTTMLIPHHFIFSWVGWFSWRPTNSVEALKAIDMLVH